MDSTELTPTEEQNETTPSGEEPETTAAPDAVEHAAGQAQEDFAELPPEVATVMNAAELLGPESAEQPAAVPTGDAHLRAMMEAIIYITEEPLTLDQIAAALEEPKDRVAQVLQQMNEEYSRPEHGVTIREVAGGYKMGTKPEHHEAIRVFVKKMKPPLKLSLAALETLAVIAYKQPITAPEIMEIRGVQGAGVIKTLLDRKVITPAGRKQVVGKPILYRTTKEFLMQFGLKDLAELPTLKEFEELRRLAFNEPDDVAPAPAEAAPSEPAPAVETTESTE